MFSKIELSNAFQQMELNPEGQQYLTINVHNRIVCLSDVWYTLYFLPFLVELYLRNRQMLQYSKKIELTH